MTKREHDIAQYIICCVGAFAQAKSLSNSQAYAYLRRYKGIDYLVKCYAGVHTLSIEDAVEDLVEVCGHNGGGIS